MEYIKHPGAITGQSMNIISQYTAKLRLGPVEEQIVKRVIHTTGDPDIASLIEFHPRFVAAAFAIFSQNKFIILTDVKMIQVGINQARAAALGGEIVCRISDPRVIQAAERNGETRAMTAVKLSGDLIEGNVVVIGNAPTALFTVLELAARGVRPGAVIGTPVGFVGAGESKEMLMSAGLPYVTVRGTRGGSAIATAVVNALLYNFPYGPNN